MVILVYLAFKAARVIHECSQNISPVTPSNVEVIPTETMQKYVLNKIDVVTPEDRLSLDLTKCNETVVYLTAFRENADNVSTMDMIKRWL